MAERREFLGRLIVAGPTRTMVGEAGGYHVPAGAIREAVAAGLFRGLACFADHADRSPSVRRLVGVWRDVVFDEAAGAAVGRLCVYETAGTRPVVALLEQWLERDGAAERPDLGISLVFYPQLAEDGRTVRRIVMVESADVVMFPASTGSRIVGGVTSDGQRATSEEGGGGSDGSGMTSDKAREGDGDDSHSQLALWAIGRGNDVLPKEIDEMARMMDRNEAREAGSETAAGDVRRVALVRGVDDGPGATGDGTPGSRASAAGTEREQGAVVVGPPGVWLDALTTAATTAVIRASGLPAVVQERLAMGHYRTPDELHGAVDAARAELAALGEAGVVRLDGVGAGGRRGMSLVDPLDSARDQVAFFFGAAGAPMPPPNLRSFADLYVALTGDVYFRGTFDGGRVLFSGATTSTLPNLAVDAMNRVIVEQFQALDHYRWYERISAVEPNDGRLHDMKWITLGGIGDLPAVGEGAAYTELSVSDARESAAFVKRGGYVGITREMIKNGDIMQLQAIPRALASAAVRTRSAAVSALFTANNGVGPTLAQDSTALFHTDHANVATTALGTDATAWRAARAECFQQVELGSGKPLGLFPRYLLVPAELYDTALSILGYGEGMPTAYAPEAQGRGFADPRPVPLVVPDWTDATDWAYIVDPAVFPVIQMSYSQAPGGRRHPIPELFAVVSDTSGLLFTNDTLPIKVRDEFAVGVNGPRGIGKRNVA